MHKIITKKIDLNGRELKLETGKLALQADAAVLVTWGETVLLATVATKPMVQDIGYFPLSVEYVEKYYAGGRITSQKFIKREGRPTDASVLSGRAIDRSIRPLFPKDFRDEVQVIISVLSYDAENDPALLGLIGASAALSISSVPFNGPISMTEVTYKDGQFMINPKMADVAGFDMDLLVAGGSEKVVMIEAQGRQVADEIVFEGIKKGFEANQAVVSLINDFVKEAGKTKKEYTPLAEAIEEALMKEAKGFIHERIEKALFDSEHPWHEATGDMIKSELAVKYGEVLTPQIVSGLFDKVAKELMHETVLNQGKRVDGRAMDEVRELYAEAGLFPRTHGSALFQRGDTQVLSIATLGSLSASQTLEGMEGEAKKRLMHHYNMAINPFSTGEPKRLGSPNRRDIGHGNLVEISLLGVLPTEEEFPYAIRVVSEVLAANASTSQASVCAASLAMLNAGVNIEPVAGIAMGLFSEDKKFQVITDMRAVEDFYGEMDFKVAGTKKGITGIQMDTKLIGLTFEIIEEALKQGKKAREVILAKMAEVMPKAGPMSQYAPKIEVVNIKPEQIGMLIGPGGKNINGIIERTGASIDIEDDGRVMVYSNDAEAIEKAITIITGMFKEFTVGEEMDGKVVRLATFGAFVELAPGKDGLVHVSQMAAGRVEKPEDVVSEGQTVHVRVTEVDSTTGKIGLSMLFGADMKPDSERGRSGGGSRGFGGPRDDRRPGGDSRPSRGGTRGRFGR